MIALFLTSVTFVIGFKSGLCQEYSTTTAQSICDSMGNAGLYPNDADTSCKQYAKCFNSNNVLTGAFYNCTGSTLFDPTLQLCTTGYTCTITSTTPSTTTTITTRTQVPTTAATTTAPISAQSICDSETTTGLYPNPDDTLCKQYAKCFTSNGSMVGSYYNCTGTTLFNPQLQLCTTNYTCMQ